MKDKEPTPYYLTSPDEHAAGLIVVGVYLAFWTAFWFCFLTLVR